LANARGFQRTKKHIIWILYAKVISVQKNLVDVLKLHSEHMFNVVIMGVKSCDNFRSELELGVPTLYYNLMYPMELGAIIFRGLCPKIPFAFLT
jgi:hypothetical protein